MIFPKHFCKKNGHQIEFFFGKLRIAHNGMWTCMWEIRIRESQKIHAACLERILSIGQCRKPSEAWLGRNRCYMLLQNKTANGPNRRVRQQLWLTGACTLDQQRRLWASDSIGDFRIDGTLFGFAFRSVELHLKKIGACGGPRFFLRLQRDPFGERKGRNRVSDSRYF